MSLLIIKNGAAIDEQMISPAAIVSADGSTVSIGSQTLHATDFGGDKLAIQPGAGIGWVASGGVLVAPAAAAPSLPQLQAALVAATTGTCAALVAQILPDPVRQSAYQLAAAMCGPSATPPAVDPTKTTFEGLAAQYGLSPQQLATLVVAIAAAAMQLRTIQQAAATAASAATTAAQLATALVSFETSLGALISTLNAALVSPISTPPAISIAGVNA